MPAQGGKSIVPPSGQVREARAGNLPGGSPTCFLDAVVSGVQRFWGIIQKIVRTAMKHLVIFLLLLVPVLASCSGEKDGKGGRQAAPVHVMTVQPRDVPRVLGAVGNVRASASVGLTPRVTGEIEKGALYGRAGREGRRCAADHRYPPL